MPPLPLGKRRYDAKQKGFGGQTKPIFHKKVISVMRSVTCRRSRPRSWCSVSSARSARPRLRDLLRDARPLRSVRRRTRTLRPIKRIAVFLPFVGRYALSSGVCSVTILDTVLSWCTERKQRMKEGMHRRRIATLSQNG